jgi:fluoroacetyl-CoA thioesterase
MSELKVGATGTSSTTVTEHNTAAALGSGSLKVFGTPAMIALVEEAACSCLTPTLDSESTSVGTHIDVKHLSPTPIGDTVTATVTVTEIDRRRVSFDVVVSDSTDVIGKGVHSRFIVNATKFMSKANAKSTSSDSVSSAASQ